MKLNLITTLAVAVLGACSLLSANFGAPDVRVLSASEARLTRGANDDDAVLVAKYCDVTFKQRMCNDKNSVPKCSGSPGHECKACRLDNESATEKAGTCITKPNSECTFLDPSTEKCGVVWKGACQYDEVAKEWYCDYATATKDKCDKEIIELCM